MQSLRWGVRYAIEYVDSSASKRSRCQKVTWAMNPSGWAVASSPAAMLLRIVAGLLLISMGLYLGGWWSGLTRIEALGRGLWRILGDLLAEAGGDAGVLGGSRREQEPHDVREQQGIARAVRAVNGAAERIFHRVDKCDGGV